MLNLSRVERRLGRPEAAVSLASRVLETRPSCAQAWLSILHVNQGRGLISLN